MNSRAFFKVAVLVLLTVVLAPASAAVAGLNLADMLASNAATQATAVAGFWGREQRNVSITDARHSEQR